MLPWRTSTTSLDAHAVIPLPCTITWPPTEPVPVAASRSARMPPPAPTSVEIVCADAQFLFERASRDPSRHYVGLEIREDLVHYVQKKAKKLGLPVQAVWCHAQLHTSLVLPQACASRVYVNFPDPWFKRRH